MSLVSAIPPLLASQPGRVLDLQVAEQIMGLHLDWTHAAIRAIVDEPESRASNEGRGIYIGCSGCDRRGFGNQVDWTLRCAAPECPPFSTDLASAWQVVEHLDSKRFGVWFDGAHLWVVSAADVAAAICRAALAISSAPPTESVARCIDIGPAKSP